MAKAKLKPAELRDQTLDELHQKERELAEQLFALRLQKVTGQLEKPSRVRELRRDLARVLTVLSAKQAAAGGR
ncbi:MAG TPA: 50S ribosomal protein L29 [Thermoanaerobaculia bacterium]|nr:50S ribosomal protein L29 [Thermoanaerobaculia bacterium]